MSEFDNLVEHKVNILINGGTTTITDEGLKIAVQKRLRELHTSTNTNKRVMNTTEKNQIIANFLHGKNAVHPNQYHENWNELMQVVEKIENIDFELSIRGNSVTIVNRSGNNPYFQPHSIEKTKIESVYNACIKFIYWYNKNAVKEN